MSHHHDDHEHHHKEHLHHGEEHGHEHKHDAPEPLQKLIKMVEHWIHHNEDHAQSFKDWAGRARELEKGEVATLLEDVAYQSLQQNEQLRRALSLLKHA
jgi:hypothetical protein